MRFIDKDSASVQSRGSSGVERNTVRAVLDRRSDARYGSRSAKAFEAFEANSFYHITIISRSGLNKPVVTDCRRRQGECPKAGFTREELAEKAHIAAALRAGAALTHGLLALKLFGKA